MRVSVATLIVSAALGCDKAETSPTASTASAKTPVASAAAPASASAAPVAQAAWYVGKWSGSYEAQHYLIEVKKGEGLKQWADDEGKEGAGDGKLELDVGQDGTISGTASGVLGEMLASGRVDEESFRVQLKPKNPTEASFQGFFVAKREGAAVKGRLSASSGDSLKVRDAPVKLEKSK
jgi:hypothetical protein